MVTIKKVPDRFLFLQNITQNYIKIFRLRRFLQGQIPLLSHNIPQIFRLRRFLQGQIHLLSHNISRNFRLRRFLREALYPSGTT